MNKYLVLALIFLSGSLQAMQKAEDEVQALEKSYRNAKSEWYKCLWSEDLNKEQQEEQTAQAFIKMMEASVTWREQVYLLAEAKSTLAYDKFCHCNDDTKDRLGTEGVVERERARAEYMNYCYAFAALEGARAELAPSDTCSNKGPLITSACAGSVITAVIGLVAIKYFGFKRVDAQEQI